MSFLLTTCRKGLCRLGSGGLIPGIFSTGALFILVFTAHLQAQDKPQDKPKASENSITIDWANTISVSKTTPTLQVVVNPMLRTQSHIHNGSFAALKELGADFVRFVPWFPYPHMAVAELKPPSGSETFWDFSQVDPMVKDFMEATNGHSVVMNFSTIPAWMFNTDAPVLYPSDPDEVSWSYNQGTELRDTTMQEVTDYFVRLFSWYTKGGFTDESGKFHKSGYYYKIPYWEVLNEPDLEHNISVQYYTRIYDAIVPALKKISPETKFIGISLAFTKDPEWFEYFLNPSHHKKGVLPEGISYHFYGTRASGTQTELNQYQYSFFDQANGFLEKVRYIENIRKRLAPHTFTTINEIGSILSGADEPGPVPEDYWNLSGTLFSYLFLELTKLGIDVAGESQLVGYPTQFPSVSMINWTNGNPNARYWALRLLKENFGPGDKLIGTVSSSGDLAAQAFLTRNGKKLLLINKLNKEVLVQLPKDSPFSQGSFVDVRTGAGHPDNLSVDGPMTKIMLRPFAVAVLSAHAP